MNTHCFQYKCRYCGRDSDFKVCIECLPKEVLGRPRTKRTAKYTAEKAYIAKYGISLEEKFQLLEKQGNKCKSCGYEAAGNENSRFWHTDHCHKTKKIRAILCWRCNMALGMVKDNAKQLRQIADYIEQFQ